MRTLLQWLVAVRAGKQRGGNSAYFNDAPAESRRRCPVASQQDWLDPAAQLATLRRAAHHMQGQPCMFRHSLLHFLQVDEACAARFACLVCGCQYDKRSYVLSVLVASCMRRARANLHSLCGSLFVVQQNGMYPQNFVNSAV